MTILLTGATGFLGSHLLNKLIQEEYNVVILKRTTSDTWRINLLLPYIISYDIDVISLDRIFQEQTIDLVIHTATSYGREVNEKFNLVNTNVVFSLKLLEVAISSNVTTFINTDTFFNTDGLSYTYLNSYSLSKRQFVEWLKSFSSEIQVINLKLEHVFGRNDSDTKFVTWLTNQLQNNVSKIDLTEGSQHRDFIYVDDVVDVYILMINISKELNTDFNEFDVGRGEQITLKEFILKLYDSVSSLKKIKTQLNFGAIAYREGEFMEVEENIQPLFSLGWKPKITIEEGIKKIVNGEKND